MGDTFIILMDSSMKNAGESKKELHADKSIASPYYVPHRESMHRFYREMARYKVKILGSVSVVGQGLGRLGYKQERI